MRARQQQVVAELGTFALRNLTREASDLRAFMDRVVRVVAETLGIEYCKVLELLPGGEFVRLVAGVGWREGLVGAAVVDTGEDSQAGYTLLSDEPVVVEDLGSESRFRGPPLLVEHGVVSGMSCVITGPDSRAWGVLGAHTVSRRVFSADDVHFLQAVANLLGAAVQRQRMMVALWETERALREHKEQLEERVQAATQQVRELAATLSRAEQNERVRIAQILHDDVQQLLYALKVQVELVQGASDVGEVLGELGEAHELVQRAIDSTRRLTLAMNPPVLREEGLASALRWLAAEMGESYPLRVQLRLDLAEGDPFSVDERALVLHTARELLFNVVKHAGVDCVELRAGVQDHALVVEVVDAGVGFAPEEALARRTRGFGLANIHERLQLNGGRLDIHASPGSGTRAVITLPLPSAG